MPSSLESLFKSIWLRALNLSSLEMLTAALVEEWVAEKGYVNPTAQDSKAGAFWPIPCVLLTVDGMTACFPKISASNDPQLLARKEAFSQQALLWDKMEWFIPLWVAMGEIRKIQESVKQRSREQAVKLFDYHTSTIYSLAFQAVCIAQILPLAPSLKEIVPLAREAYLGFYSGYRASSIAALIPAIEGGLTRMAADLPPDATTEQKIDNVINRAVENTGKIHFNRMWVPREYLTTEYLFAADERVFVLETFRHWLKNYFFCNTDSYKGVNWLNRHMFAHGTASSWQESSNFSRLVVALATLAAVESWHDDTHSVSVFFPEMNKDSELLWQQAQFQIEIQMPLKLIEQDRYHKHGRLVPEMPTDNGVTLRKAILTEDCMRDLVRPLRESGWSVDVDEADPEALYMKVMAAHAERKLRVALLYSCGTDNSIYRMLEKDCDTILYRGAPYLQEQFARGITKHVGPVLGWQPPKANAEAGL